MTTKINNRRVVRFIPVMDGAILDLPHMAVPGVSRRGSPSGPGVFAFNAPESGIFVGGHGVPMSLISGDHLLIGYQPSPLNPRARKPYEPAGWLIVLVDESVASRPQRLRANARTVS